MIRPCSCIGSPLHYCSRSVSGSGSCSHSIPIPDSGFRLFRTPFFIHQWLFWALIVTSETKQDIKQAVIETKKVADQLQVLAGQLDRLADQILRQATKYIFFYLKIIIIQFIEQYLWCAKTQKRYLVAQAAQAHYMSTDVDIDSCININLDHRPTFARGA